jgi:hypothetical protein
MKRNILNLRKLVLYAGVLGGLLYSVCTLTVTAPSASASSCDCNEAYQDAQELCSTHDGIYPNQFDCPVADSYFAVICLDHTQYLYPCTY